jgi:uncharacterized protein DUF4245
LIYGIGDDRCVTTTQPAPPPTVNTAALRLSRTPADMTKAVLVLLVPVAILVALYVYFFGGNNVIQIDPSQSYSDARASAHFTVLQPAGLSSGWKPVSSQFTPGATSTLRVGYIAPDGSGIQLVETDQAAGTVIASELGNVGSLAKSVDAGGRTWGVLQAKNSDLALVDTESSRTVIISGQASQTDLQDFASSLS